MLLGKSSLVNQSQLIGDENSLLSIWFRKRESGISKGGCKCLLKGHPSPRLSSWAVSWISPLVDCWKLNMDPSVRRGMASGGGLVCGFAGEFYFSFYSDVDIKFLILFNSILALFFIYSCFYFISF